MVVIYTNHIKMIYQSPKQNLLNTYKQSIEPGFPGSMQIVLFIKA